MSWLSVEGASWYEVQSSIDGQNWTNLGRVSETQTLILGDPGTVYACVRAGNDQYISSWSQWHGNTTAIAPAVPQPRLASGVYNGSATITWPKIDEAESYIVTLRNTGGVGFYTTEITENTFEITPEIQTGGPYRNLRVDVAAKNEAGVSSAGRVELSAETPPVPTEVYGAPSGSSFILAVVKPEYEKRTGYVVVYGNSEKFDASNFFGVQIIKGADGLPATLSYPGNANFYRVAFTDAFFDAAPNPSSLSFSGVYPIYFDSGGPER